jgi:hypothetical protein
LREQFAAPPKPVQKERPRDEEERHEADVVEHLQEKFDYGFHSDFSRERTQRSQKKADEPRDLFPSFPSCTWERSLLIAKFHFALMPSGTRNGESAIKLPQQVRSQVQLGNEEGGR